jgi:hypothetical protein
MFRDSDKRDSMINWGKFPNIDGKSHVKEVLKGSRIQMIKVP